MLHGPMFCVTWQSLIQLHSLVLCVVLSVVGVVCYMTICYVLHGIELCITWSRVTEYMVLCCGG